MEGGNKYWMSNENLMNDNLPNGTVKVPLLNFGSYRGYREKYDAIASYLKCSLAQSNPSSYADSLQSVLDEIKADWEMLEISGPRRDHVQHFFNTALPSFVKCLMSLR